MFQATGSDKYAVHVSEQNFIQLCTLDVPVPPDSNFDYVSTICIILPRLVVHHASGPRVVRRFPTLQGLSKWHPKIL